MADSAATATLSSLADATRAVVSLDGQMFDRYDDEETSSTANALLDMRLSAPAVASPLSTQQNSLSTTNAVDTEAGSSPTSKYPVRNRKRNRFIFNDEEETERVPYSRANLQNSPIKSQKRGLPGSPAKNADNGKHIDRRLAHKAGLSLRTLLKLPKAHKWVCYEWFYANIDQTLFLGENDFQAYLKDSFPQLKTRLLRKVEWSKIRRLMGKPRRCSSAFFLEERQALNNRRNKIRYLQVSAPVGCNVSMHH